MNIETYLKNPELILGLNDTQKTELFQQLDKVIESHTQEKIKISTELEMKKQEQLKILETLKTLTGKTEVKEIQDFLVQETEAFNKVLISTLTKLNELEKALYGEE